MISCFVASVYVITGNPEDESVDILKLEFLTNPAYPPAFLLNCKLFTLVFAV